VPSGPGAKILLRLGELTADEVARRLEPLFPALDEAGREISLDIYRRLARGAPVVLCEAAAARVRKWPGVYYDSRGRIVGYWGLSLAPMRHRLRIGARELFAWCAWDTLFLPAVLGTRIEVESERVHLVVSPEKVEAADPPGLLVSFVVPSGEGVRADIITSFCHHVHFYTSETAEKPPGAFLLSLAEAFEVGRLLNRRRYGAAL